MTTPKIALRSHGYTHQGNVRDANEDAMLLAADIGLWAVLDGMGGHMAGDVASAKARDTINEYVRAHRGSAPAPDVLAAAIHAGAAAVHGEARARRDRHGMGTTVVACMMVDQHRAVIGHVGDSRAYLVREGRLQLLTRDHTVVAELVANGAIKAEEAHLHPYKSVLSRNLGAKPEARADLLEITLQLGDRIMLCSDGLNGFASAEAIEQVLGGAESPENASRDLVELALRGGGGDNVSVVVIEAGRAAVPRSTQIIRQSGSVAWWQRRELFLGAARDRGVARSPLCALLQGDEAVDIVAGNLCEAIFHDLEQTSGLNVWTYAENLAAGWLDQDGNWKALRDLLDMLRECAFQVVADVAAAGGEFAVALETAITRAFTVAEMAVGGQLAERVRRRDAELAKEQAARQAERRLTDQPTIPYMNAVKVDPPSPEIAGALERAVAQAQRRLARSAERQIAEECIQRAHRLCLQGVNDATLVARELFGARALEEAGVAPLLEGLDQARIAHLAAVRALPGDQSLCAAALRRVAAAHQKLASGIAHLVVEGGKPISDALQQAAEETAKLRAQLGQGEAKLAKLEREMVTHADMEPPNMKSWPPRSQG
jgi:protein phosphatase